MDSRELFVAEKGISFTTYEHNNPNVVYPNPHFHYQHQHYQPPAQLNTPDQAVDEFKTSRPLPDPIVAETRPLTPPHPHPPNPQPQTSRRDTETTIVIDDDEFRPSKNGADADIAENEETKENEENKEVENKEKETDGDNAVLYFKWLEIIKNLRVILREKLIKINYNNMRALSTSADSPLSPQAPLFPHLSRNQHKNANANSASNSGEEEEDSDDMDECTDFKKRLIKSVDVRFLKDLKDFTPKTFYTELIVNANNDTYLLVISLLKDKIYQLYLEQTEQYEWIVERAKRYLPIVLLYIFDGKKYFKSPKKHSYSILEYKNAISFLVKIIGYPQLPSPYVCT